MAYLIRVGAERHDNLTPHQALARTRELLDSGTSGIFIYDIEGNPMNLRELVLAVTIDDARRIAAFHDDEASSSASPNSRAEDYGSTATSAAREPWCSRRC